MLNELLLAPYVLPLIGASLVAASTGVMFKPGAWYRSLVKPSWTPPNLAFPIVWTVLYVLMTWAAARIAVLPGNALAMGLYCLQISLNTLWTPVFFGAHRVRIGLVVLLLLVLAVAGTGLAFLRLDLVAGLMFLPYFLWLLVAFSLNFRIWRDTPRDTLRAGI